MNTKRFSVLIKNKPYRKLEITEDTPKCRKTNGNNKPVWLVDSEKD
ncbi:hypothetical protein [Anaerosporobacter faecicola]|nr:hypothetical protein [Anaerosporobacter faecicola]